MPKIYIGLVGEGGGGKDTVAKIFEEKYGALVLTSSGLLKKALGVFLDEIARHDYIWFVEKLTERYGDDIISKAMLRSLHESEKEIVVFNGMRLASDYEYMRREERCAIIYVTADPKIRWERISGRGEKTDDNAPFEEFMKMAETKTERDIPVIGAKADYRIDNNGTLEELKQRVDEVVTKILNCKF